MKIFDTKEGAWSEKVNFVDQNNVYLGYDMDQNCCEHADWFIHTEPTSKTLDTKRTDLEDFCFDKKFFHTYEVTCDDSDTTNMAVFKITDGKTDLYIHLFNCHNGYYGHGFDFKINNRLTREGSL